MNRVDIEKLSLLTRRQFIERTSAVSIASMLLVTACTTERHTSSVSLPSDTLSEQALEKSRIAIHQTPTVQLYLRKSVFDQFPVFQDSSKGGIKGVVISLIDNPFISWNAIKRLPDDARTAYQAHQEDPAEYPDSYWEGIMKFWKGQKDFAQEMLKLFESNPTEEDLRKRGFSRPHGITLEQEVEYEISTNKRIIKRAEEMTDLVNDRQKAVEYYAENGAPPIFLAHPPVGLAGMTRRSTFEQMLTQPDKYHPDHLRRIAKLLTMDEYLDKYYTFVAVGGERTPEPKYSYPSPDQFEVLKLEDEDARFIHQKPEPGETNEPPSAAGFTIRHELYHYDPTRLVSSPEHTADQRALDSIITANNRRKRLGNSSLYTLVLVSPKGITVT